MNILEKLAKKSKNGTNSLKSFAERMKEAIEQSVSYEVKPRESKYVLFSQQFLEKPIVSGDYQMALTPTASSFKDVPVIDDF